MCHVAGPVVDVLREAFIENHLFQMAGEMAVHMAFQADS